MIAELLAAEMQGDEGYIAEFSGQLDAIGGFGGMKRHFCSGRLRGQASRARVANLELQICNHGTTFDLVILYVDYECGKGHDATNNTNNT